MRCSINIGRRCLFTVGIDYAYVERLDRRIHYFKNTESSGLTSSFIHRAGNRVCGTKPCLCPAGRWTVVCLKGENHERKKVLSSYWNCACTGIVAARKCLC